MRRIVPLLAAVAAGAGLAACEAEEVRHAEGEGIYVTVGELRYQVQISRLANPADAEDRAFFAGVAPEELKLKAGEQWFAIFMRVENEGDEPHTSAAGFVIEDTVGDHYEPLEIDTAANPLAYRPAPVAPGGGLNPASNSVPHDSATQGSVLLFRMTNDALENRPLELKIESAEGEGSVELDV